MPNDIQLSNNFWLSEMVKSSTADRLDIDNWPTEQWIIDNLRNVAYNILQPVRDHYGVAIRPSSGYRCLQLNRAIGSKDTSQHTKGQAVDFEIPGCSNYDVAYWVEQNLNFDQLLLEFYDPQSGANSGWIHCSYVDNSSNRNQVLTINRRVGTVTGLLK